MRLTILSLAACALLAVVFYRIGLSEPGPVPVERTQSSAVSGAAEVPRDQSSLVEAPEKPAEPVSKPMSAEAAPAHYGRDRQDFLDPATFDHSDYAFYETAILSELAENGDATAMQVLAMRFFTTELSEENLEKAKALMRDAAAYGARHYPFSTMAENTGFELELALLGRLQMPEERLREVLVETLSYGELAAMRGNEQLKSNLNHKFTRQYGLSLTDDEVAEIRRRAEARYEELEARRAELGLGPFDELPEDKSSESVRF